MTKAEARAARLRTADALHAQRLAPRRGAEPAAIIDGQRFYSEDQCEELLYEAGLKRQGLKLRPDAKPEVLRRIGRRNCGLYRRSDAIDVDQARRLPAQRTPPAQYRPSAKG